MRNIAGALLLAVSATLAAGCQQGEERAETVGNVAAPEAGGGQTQTATVGQALSQSGDHSSFVSAVNAAGLDGTIAGTQPYTVFAPTNAAFQKLPQGTAENLMQPAQKGELTSIVTYHIVPGVVTGQDLTRAIERGGGKAEIATMAGGNLTAAQSDGAILITDAKGGQARVTPGTQAQSNGVVHSVDTILMPS